MFENVWSKKNTRQWLYSIWHVIKIIDEKSRESSNNHPVKYSHVKYVFQENQAMINNKYEEFSTTLYDNEFCGQRPDQNVWSKANVWSLWYNMKLHNQNYHWEWSEWLIKWKWLTKKCEISAPIYVIMEFVAKGKLQEFLRKSRAEHYYGNLYGECICIFDLYLYF